ncbi:unnamed protein product [Mytilus coruscus]|uniref:Uncharacterized protein n=1 Tax=Mytilus coruscus TaxID=42192 RepID=A0A6J8DU36_MYTCO|nr:unnamed protein product [Mytilus coruscus]
MDGMKSYAVLIGGIEKCYWKEGVVCSNQGILDQVTCSMESPMLSTISVVKPNVLVLTRLQSNSPGLRPRTQTLHPGTLSRPCKRNERLHLPGDSKKAVASAATPVTTTSTTVDNICQTQARDTVIGTPLTRTKYRGEPEGINIKTDIVTSPYNSQKACHRRYFYTLSKPRSKRSRIDFIEGFDIDGPDLLRTPSHTSPISMPDPEAIQTAFALQERPDTPYQPQPPGRSKMKGKRTADPTP